MNGSSNPIRDDSLDQAGERRFLGIVAWIAANNPAAASRVGQRILDAVQHLGDFPLLGRPGRSPGTLELMISRLPYLVVYSVDAADPQTVVILRVLHGARLWPSAAP